MKQRTVASDGAAGTAAGGRARKTFTTVVFTAALLAATGAVNPASAQDGGSGASDPASGSASDSGSASASGSAPASAKVWPGPDPREGPGPLTVAGRTYPDDAQLPGMDRPDAPSEGADAGRGGPCAGETNGHRVKTYKGVREESTMPLRCGRWDSGSGWGKRKLDAKDRWSVWWDGMIGTTLQNPDDVVPAGTSKTYKSEWFEECNPEYRFIVVTETKTYGDGKQGVLNAYKQYR